MRIFYNARRGNTGRMSLRELRRCGLVATIATVDAEPDINRSTDVFSYEHFYVVYCKFWELDKDHDLIIDADGLFFFLSNAHITRSNILYRLKQIRGRGTYTASSRANSLYTNFTERFRYPV